MRTPGKAEHAGGEEDVALHVNPVEVGVRAHQHGSPKSTSGWPSRPRRTAFSITMQRSPNSTGPPLVGQHGAKKDAAIPAHADIAAQHGVGRHVGGRVDLRTVALVLDQHRANASAPGTLVG